MRNRLAEWVNAGRVGLYRDTHDGWIAGVCAGIAERLTIKPFWVRLAFVATALLDRVAPTVIVYLLLMLALERRGSPMAMGRPMGSAFLPTGIRRRRRRSLVVEARSGAGSARSARGSRRWMRG